MRNRYVTDGSGLNNVKKCEDTHEEPKQCGDCHGESNNNCIQEIDWLVPDNCICK